MKKITVFLILFLATASYSQFSVNIGGGKDFYTIDAIDGMNFSLWDTTPAYIEREEISNPVYFNIQLEYQHNSFIYGLHLAAAYQSYRIKYIYFPDNLWDFDEYVTEEDVPWARLEINGVILYEVNVSEKFSLLLGGGGGIQIMPPIVSDKYVYETTFNKALDMDFSDDVELEYLPNGKAIARAKYKLSDTFSLAAEANYLFVKEGDYEQPSKFLTAAIFFGITF